MKPDLNTEFALAPAQVVCYTGASVRGKEFAGIMMQLEAYSVPGAFGSPLVRLPMVLLLTIGLLLSMIHCAGCELNFASAEGPAVTVSHNQGSVPGTPEQLLPCHSGHCLSHIAAQPALAVALPADHHPRKHLVRQEQFPVALAGLPLFKPPRT